MRRFLISDVISSFSEALKLSKTLPSILLDFGFESPAMVASCPKGQEFPTNIGETKSSLTLSVLSSWLFFLFWFLVVDNFERRKFDLKNSSYLCYVFSNEVEEISWDEWIIA